MAQVDSYLTFSGSCEEAFLFYQSVFGGDFSYIERFKNMPPDPNFPLSEVDKERIMHVSLPIGSATVLMGSDSLEVNDKEHVVGNNFSISVSTDTVEEATRIFNELSAGGVVKMPLDKTFWGAYFGMFTDKFGIQWMVNCDLKESK